MMNNAVNLSKNHVNWFAINVKSAKYAGTLEEVNCAIMPKKSDCSERAWQGMGCLDAIWKAFVRRDKFPKDADRHTNSMNAAIHDFYVMSALNARRYPETLFRDYIVGALNVHYTKSKALGEGFAIAQCATFKKSALRITMRMQRGTFSLINNVKNDKTEGVSLNVKGLSNEQICSILGIDLDVWERVQAAQAAKKAQAC